MSQKRIRDTLNALAGSARRCDRAAKACRQSIAEIERAQEPPEPQSAPAKYTARVIPEPPPAVTSLKIDAHNLKLKLDAINACLDAIKREPKLGETLHFILPRG